MLVFADRIAAQLELEAFSRRSDLLQVQVQLPDGTVFAHWQADHQAAPLHAQAPAGLARTGIQSSVGWSALEVWAPVRLKDELVGVLVLRESLASLHLSVLLLSTVAIALMVIMILVAWRGWCWYSAVPCVRWWSCRIWPSILPSSATTANVPPSTGAMKWGA
jgi:hypothetical protein